MILHLRLSLNYDRGRNVTNHTGGAVPAPDQLVAWPGAYPILRRNQPATEQLCIIHETKLRVMRMMYDVWCVWYLV